MQKYLDLVRKVMDKFQEVKIQHIPKEQNTKFDLLSKFTGSRPIQNHRTMIQETLATPSILQNVKINVVAQQSTNDQRTPIERYIRYGELLVDKTKAKRIIRISVFYYLYGDNLYWRGYSQPLLKCVGPDQSTYILHEVYEGICGHHVSTRTLVSKVMRSGYFWPTMKADSKKVV